MTIFFGVKFKVGPKVIEKFRQKIRKPHASPGMAELAGFLFEQYDKSTHPK